MENSHILIHFEPSIDTEYIAFKSDGLDIKNESQINKFSEVAKELGLEENLKNEYLVNYQSNREFRHRMSFYKVRNQSSIHKIIFNFDSNFHINTESELNKSKIHKIMSKKFRKTAPSIQRIDIYQDLLTQTNTQIFDIFPNIFDTKKYKILSKGININVGHNDPEDPNRITHIELSVYRRAKLKIYDKTNSIKRLLKNDEMTYEEYKKYEERYGTDENGNLNQVWRIELSLSNDYCGMANTLLLKARVEKWDNNHIQWAYRQILAHFASNHRIVLIDTIPENGNIYQAKTCPIYEKYMFLNDKSGTLTKLKRFIAKMVKLPEETLSSFVSSPSPKRTIDSYAKSSAKKILGTKDGQKNTKALYRYFCRRLKRHLATEKRNLYTKYYHYYLQKAFLSIDDNEKKYWKNEAIRARDEGFLEYHLPDESFHGWDGERKLDIIKKDLQDIDLIEALFNS